MNFKAAIFDFDGTLVDSMGMLEKLVLSWAQNNKIEISDEILNKAKYFTIDEMSFYISENYKDIDIKKAVRKLSVYALFNYVFTVKQVKGAKAYLKNLHKNNIKIALATNCPPFLCKVTLKRMGMYKYIDALVFSKTIGKSKREPDIFLKAAELLSTEPKNCMVFEDSPASLEGARLAGMQFAGVYEKHSPYNELMKEKSDLFILNYYELLREAGKSL